MIIPPPWLKDLFIRSQGKPIYIEGKKIIQMDRLKIPSSALVEIRFIGDKVFLDNAAVIAVDKPDKIFLSDGSAATAVAIWDEPDLPREINHVVKSDSKCLKVYNKYRLRHSEDFITEDRFTGNAGMHVIEIAENIRRYECSNGAGPFSLNDLVFELSWEPYQSEDR